MSNRVQIAPSVLSADFARLAEEIRAVERGGASIIHLDVMDGHFVPNITIGPPVVASVRKTTRLPLDCHLMISDPDRYASEFCKAGADMVSVHQEACIHLDRTLNHIRDCGAQPGVVLNPGTPIETLTEVIDLVDYVLLMSVNPGFGGQEFIPRTLDKVRRLALLRDDRGLDFRIEIDGGITPSNILDVVKAGAEILVIGATIFRSGDATAMVETLLKKAGAAALTQT